MRCVLAICLLLLVLSNCLEGLGLRCASVRVHKSAAPSAVEQGLLRQLQYALEQDQVLKTVGRTFNGRRGWAYPADFVYAAVVECDTTYFIVHNKPQEDAPYTIIYTGDGEQPVPAEAPAPGGFQNWYLAQGLPWPVLVQLETTLRGIWPAVMYHYASPCLLLLAPPPEWGTPLPGLLS